MYVHIGGDTSIPVDKISVLLNLETVLPSQADVNEFIKAEDDGNRLDYVSGDLPKSLVITEHRTYVSPVSVSVLTNRIVNSKNMEK